MHRENKAEANLIIAFVFLLLAAAVIMAIKSEPSLTGWWRGMLYVIAVILVIAAIWFGGIAVRQLQMREAFEMALLKVKQAEADPTVAKWRAKTAYISRLETLSERTKQILLTDPQLANAIRGTFGPAVGLNTADGVVPYAFIDYFMTLNEGRDVLVPVRAPKVWNTVQDRADASALMRHLIQFKYCVSWGGNQTAKWAYADAAADFIRDAYGNRVNRVVMTDDDEDAA